MCHGCISIQVIAMYDRLDQKYEWVQEKKDRISKTSKKGPIKVRIDKGTARDTGLPHIKQRKHRIRLESIDPEWLASHKEYNNGKYINDHPEAVHKKNQSKKAEETVGAEDSGEEAGEEMDVAPQEDEYDDETHWNGDFDGNAMGEGREE